jgi:hypothetical protein
MDNRIIHSRGDAIASGLGPTRWLLRFRLLDGEELMRGRARVPTVLVVDDEPVICMLAGNCLRDAGFRTLEAHSFVRIDVCYSFQSRLAR